MENIVLISFASADRADDARRKLRRLHDEGSIRVDHAVLVERDGEGAFRVIDPDTPGFTDTAIGGAVGGLLGALVGPLGVLVGGAAGAAIGTMAGAEDEADSQAMVIGAFDSVPRGSTTLIVSVDEPGPELIDAAMEARGGQVVRASKAAFEAGLAHRRG